MVTTLHKGISSCCTNKIHVLQAPLWWELKKNATFILIFQYKLYNKYLVNTANLWYLKQFCHIYIYYIFMINVSPRLVYYMYYQEPSWCWSCGSWIYIYCLPVQSVHITTKVVIQHYVRMFVSDLGQICGFLRHDINEILLKMMLNTITQNLLLLYQWCNG
jgi:hypothetical protein